MPESDCESALREHPGRLVTPVFYVSRGRLLLDRCRPQLLGKVYMLAVTLTDMKYRMELRFLWLLRPRTISLLILQTCGRARLARSLLSTHGILFYISANLDWSILLHSAAGSIGIACVELARFFGKEVCFPTASCTFLYLSSPSDSGHD
jgi:hypothetical protein